MTETQTRRLAAALFFASGACGLVYQIAWTRRMTLVFGVSVYAVSAVLCSFMAGLALGSWIFGRAAGRIRRPLAMYGAVEIGVGIYALLFPLAMRAAEPVFVAAHHAFYGSSYAVFSLARLCIIFPILLVPTILMGGTLPLLARYFIREDSGVGKGIGALYAVNTAGAVAGVFLAGFVALAWIGMAWSIALAAVANVAIGGAAIWVDREGRAGGEAEKDKEKDKEKEKNGRRGEGAGGGLTREQRAAIVAIALSGFCSLAMEVLWSRTLVYYTHNSTYAFSAMLMVFLVGLAAGSWIYALVAERIKRPLAALAALELGIGVWGAASIFVLGALARITERLSAALPFDNWLEAMILILAQSSAVLLVPTIMMGATLPLATRIATRSAGEASRRLGEVYAANTLGTVLGSFAAGFILIPLAGLRTSFLLVAALNLAIAGGLFAAYSESMRARRIALGACAAAVAALLILPPRDIIARQFTGPLGKRIFYKEDVGDTVMVIDGRDATGAPSEALRDVVFGDGRANGGHRTSVEDRYYGHLPMLLHPNPEEALSIGVCSGNTVGAISRHASLKRLDCVELSPGVVEAARFIKTNYGVFEPGADPRVRVHIEDGRNYLLGTRERYDVININPPYVHSAGVIFLYTEEFYGLCRARLKPGGVVGQFMDPQRLTAEEQRELVATFAKAFPHVAIFHGPRLYSWNLVGSESPIAIPLKRIETRIAGDARLLASLRQDQLENPLRFFSLLLMKPESVRAYAAGARIVTDDRTMIDFSSPRSRFSGFGFMRMSKRDAAGAAISEPTEGEGGWGSVVALNRKSDHAGELIDWAGVAPEARAQYEDFIGKQIAARQAAAKSFYENLREGASVR